MPHFPALNIRLTGFTILLELYKKLFNNNKYISYNKQINYKNLKLYLQKLAENEELFIKEIPPTSWGRNPSSEWERGGASRAECPQDVVIKYNTFYIISIVGAGVPRQG